MSQLAVNIHVKANKTFAVASEANPVTGDRAAFGKLPAFVPSYTPYSTNASDQSVDAVFKNIAAASNAASPAAAQK